MNLKELRRLYGAGVNIIEHLRHQSPDLAGDFDPVAVSYDLQAGSYVAHLNEGENRSDKQKYAAELASYLLPFDPTSVLEAGVGEATTLRFVIDHLPAHCDVSGFDLSWSRLDVARTFLADELNIERRVQLVCGNLFQIPFSDESFDVVYTSHSMEPNGGDEVPILRELLRVARRALVLFEPGYELASEQAKARMIRHGYVTGLVEKATQMGHKVARHQLLKHTVNALNPTAVTVIEKAAAGSERISPQLVCPHSGSALEEQSGWFFSPQALVAYPVLRGIPILTRESAILATGLAR